MDLVEDLAEPGVSVKAACAALGASRATVYRVTSVAPPQALREPPANPRRLSDGERQAIVDVWFSDPRQLWVIDLRAPATATLVPVLIASDVPGHVELHVDRGGTDIVEPQDACDFAPFLQLHWLEEPWIEGQGGQRVTDLDGRAWLARERTRRARAPSEERWLHPSDPHVALPSARAHCEDTERCGAALPFAPSGWQLVMTDQSEGADCWQFGCLLRNSANGAFGTPPQPSRWGAPEDMPAGPCGPYRFNADESAFLVKDLVCAVAGGCQPLDGSGIGWLAPGATMGAPG